MVRRIAPMIVLALASCGCWAAHEEPIEVVACEPARSPVWFFHADEPWPRGRIHACETALRTEEEIFARQVELGCALGAAREVDGWTLHGGCDYAHASERWEAIASAPSCDALDALAADPCLRPDARHYWRRDGD